MSDLAGKQIKGYELLERIGGGGFGEVFRARQDILKREVAIKIILPEYANDPDFIRRFQVEAELVAQLEHPHIVPLFDYWREPDGAYLVMRMLRSGSLEDMLAEFGAMQPGRVANILDQIAAALTVAHRNHVIHRDLKPANILFDQMDNAYLADFGIAADITQELSDTAASMYTPYYAAPEQIKQEDINARTDIYNLGLVVFEMLTGQRPFEGGLYQVIQSHLQDPVPSLADYREGLPPELDSIIGKATARENADRYDSAATFAIAFREAVTGSTAPDSSTPAIREDDIATLPDAARPAFIDDAPTVIGALDRTGSIENPYKGLRAFREGDASDFFGRDDLTQRLLKRLDITDEGERFLAVVGPSGSGKSSVVKAGLIPALRRGALSNSDDWFIVTMFPGNSPYPQLSSALMSVAVQPPDDLAEQLRNRDRSLHEMVERILPNNTGELVLVIDQFEELFTQVEDEATRVHFIENIIDALERPQPRIRVIVTIRADFYDRPLQYEQLGGWMRQQTEVVLPLSASELESAITGPAERVGITLEPALIQTLVDEVVGQPGTLPLLQYTLTELFDRRNGRSLTLQAYRDIGGVTGALAKRSDELYNRLDDDEKQATRQLFLRLVTLGEGTEDTRRRVRRSEVATSDAVDRVIDIYGRYRLLTFDKDPDSREPTVEVAHEALIRSWDRLREWISESRDDLRVHRRLTTATGEWLKADREPSFLASGARLAQFAEWRENTALMLNEDERAYLDESIRVEEARKAEEAAIARRVQNFQRASVVLGVMVLLAGIATVVFLSRATQAQQDVASANNSLNTAEAQIVAVGETLTPVEGTVVAAQREASNANQLVLTAESQAESANARVTEVGATLTPAQATINAAQIEVENANVLASTAESQAANAQTQVADSESQLAAVGATLTPIQSTADAGARQLGTRQAELATAQVLAGNAETQVAVVQQLTRIAPTVSSVDEQVSRLEAEVSSFSATLTPAQATLSLAQTQVLDAQSQVTAVGATLTPVQETVVAAQQEADSANNLAATAQAEADSASTQVAAVDATLTPAQSTIVAAQQEAADANQLADSAQTQVAQSQRQIEEVDATLTPIQATADAGARQLGTRQAELATAQVLAGNAETQAAVVRELTRVAPTIASADERVQQLEAEVRQVGATLTPAQATVSAARSQVEEVGATLTPIQGTVVAAQARADSISLAVSADQSITNDNYDLALALSLESLRLNPNLTSSRSILNEIAFGTARFSVNDTPEAAISPAGRFFAAAQGNAVIVRDVVTREQIARLNGHTAPVQSVDFSPDGRYLASGSADSTVQVWDTSQWGDPVSTLTEHGAGVNMVRFSPATGNQTLFSTSDDNTIIRWSVPDGNLLNRYSNTWPVANIRFVGDGTQFFTEVEAGDVPILLYWAVSSTNPRYSENDLIFDAYNDDATRGIIADTASGDPLTVYNTTQRVPVRRFQGQDFNWSRDTSTAFAFSPNGRELLVGVQSTTGDNALLLLDIGTGSIVRRFEGEAAQQVDALAFNPSGDLALSASDRTLILWDVAQGQPLRTFAAHTDVVTDIEWSRDGRFAVSRSRDGNVRLWDVTGADEALRYTFEINTEIATGNFPGFNSRSDRVYAGVWTDFFEWSVQTGERQARVFVAAEILNMIYSRVQPQAITVLENTAVLWNLDAGVNGLVRRFGDGSQVFSGIAAYSPDGNYVAFDTTDAILVYNLETSSRAVLRTSSEYEVIDVAVMPGGNQVIASVSNRNQPDATGEIIVWETESESVLRRFPAEHNRRVNDIDINTDGTRLLTASDDNTLIIWSLDGDILRRLAGHSGAVNVGLFLPDGESVASASDDRTMILWDIESGQPVRIFRGSPTPITGFAVSPDGRYMATTSGDDSVRLWEITRTEELITWTQQNRFVRPLTPAECEQYNVRCDNIVPDSTGSDTTSSDTTRVDAAPQATATPLPTATIETDAEVVNTSGSGINIRTSDSTQAQLLTVLQPGDTAAIIGRSTRDTRWYQIRLDDDRIGWVRDDVISETGDVTNLPPVEPPPVVSSAPPTTNNSNNQSNTDQANTPPTGSSNANLQVTGLNYNPNPPVCNQPFRVEVNVRNTGTESTTAGTTISVTSRHIASGSVSGTASGNVPALAPGEDWFVPDVFLTVNTFFAEEHEVIVTVDPAQQVTESNEGDNSLRGTYVLQTGSCG